MALQAMLGPGAEFRPGQGEALAAVMRPQSKVLLVQGTGWGKTLVYLLATQLLQERSAGPTVVVSPLLSLMRNQVAAAQAAGIHAAAMTSENSREWEGIRSRLIRGETGVLHVSPERLAYGGFRRGVLQQLPRGIGLLVIDEAHCISEWGHDFRPDYRHVLRLVRGVQRHVRVLAMTGTATARVVSDLEEQLGGGITVLRGSLARPSLRLQVIPLRSQARRLAWLAAYLPRIAGSGIIYCLTRTAAETVAEWLSQRGIYAPAYHAGLTPAERQRREELLLANECKALCATVALGMGFDKPDLAFVIHYQRPKSLVDYYQQVGRAGRAIPEAYGVLLCGDEDESIVDYLAAMGSPSAEEQASVLSALEEGHALGTAQIEAVVNLPSSRIVLSLKQLRADGVVGWRDGRWYRRGVPWQPDYSRSASIAAHRVAERERVAAMVRTSGCLMEFVVRELGDAWASPCGHCANCGHPVFASRLSPLVVCAARHAAMLRHPQIRPRVMWPPSAPPAEPTPIDPHLRLRQGMALCLCGDPGWGKLITQGQQQGKAFSRRLVRASVQAVRQWAPRPTPTWVTSVPSQRYPALVQGFAQALARRLGIEYRAALVRAADTAPQREMRNDAHQAANARAGFRVVPRAVLFGSPVLLVDDVVDSGWTLTVCGALLAEAGAGPVFPFALGAARGWADP